MIFDAIGKENTDACLKAAYEKAQALGIDELVLATTTGETARRALELCPGMKITAVSYHAGFKEPFKLTLSDETRRELEGKGVRVVCATHRAVGR